MADGVQGQFRAVHGNKDLHVQLQFGSMHLSMIIQRRRADLDLR